MNRPEAWLKDCGNQSSYEDPRNIVRRKRISLLIIIDLHNGGSLFFSWEERICAMPL
jgi:hypothetical protein